MRTGQKAPKQRNQRLSNLRQRRQQHLLDVKVRSRRATRHRNRKVLVALSKVLLVVAFCIVVYLATLQGAKRFFFENPEYQLTAIEVQTDGALQRDQILKEADLYEGENIFSINLARVHDTIQQLPQVDEVQVVRKLPGEIDIRVIERKPVAWLTSEKEISDPFVSDAAFLVDARGVLMKQKKLLPEYLGLPLILGCSSESLEAGKVVESPAAKTALELLSLSARNLMETRLQIRDIDISKSYCLLVTDKNHARVTFGLNDLEGQLQRLEQLLVYCDNSKQELEMVNLLVQRNIPVTFTKPPTEVINDTIAPPVEPRILKAIPLHPTATRVRQGSGSQEKAPALKAHGNSSSITKTAPANGRGRTSINGKQ